MVARRLELGLHTRKASIAGKDESICGTGLERLRICDTGSELYYYKLNEGKARRERSAAPPDPTRGPHKHGDALARPLDGPSASTGHRRTFVTLRRRLTDSCGSIDAATLRTQWTTTERTFALPQTRAQSCLRCAQSCLRCT